MDYSLESHHQNKYTNYTAMKNSNIIFADLTEMLFEDRNKTYGAYVLRKEQNKNLAQAFLLTSLVLAGLIFTFQLGKSGADLVELGFTGSVLVDDSFLDDMNPPPVMPEKPDPTPATATPLTTPAQDDPADGTDEDKFLNPNPVDDGKAKGTFKPNDSLDGNPSDRDKKGNKDGMIGNDADTTGRKTGGPSLPDTKKGTADCEDCMEDKPYEPFLGTEPVPMNLNDLRGGIIYPAPLKDIGEQGSVLFRILVDKEGNYVKHITLKSSHKLFENACLPAIKQLKFKPGRQGNNPVAVWVTIPFKFSLHN